MAQAQTITMTAKTMTIIIGENRIIDKTNTTLLHKVRSCLG